MSRRTQQGRTPNPCVECNRHIKFGRLLGRARRLGFDALATGHHARVDAPVAGRWRLRRGIDEQKDQSYVLSMLTQSELCDLLLPVGDLTKAEVRRRAARARSANGIEARQPGRLFHPFGVRPGAFLGGPHGASPGRGRRRRRHARSARYPLSSW